VRSVKLVELVVDKDRKVFIVYCKPRETLGWRGKTFQIGLAVA
jgi:hypothetical protein